MKKVLLALTFVLLLLVGAPLTQATTASAATAPVVLDSLTLPAGVQVGQSITATARVHSTSGTVAVQAVTVAVRSADGTAYDFPGATAANVPTSGYTFISGARTFTAGTYQVFAAVLINGTWTNLTPGQTLTVTAVVGTVAFDSLTVPAGACESGRDGQRPRAQHERQHDGSGHHDRGPLRRRQRVRLSRRHSRNDQPVGLHLHVRCPRVSGRCLPGVRGSADRRDVDERRPRQDDDRGGPGQPDHLLAGLQWAGRSLRQLGNERPDLVHGPVLPLARVNVRLAVDVGGYLN